MAVSTGVFVAAVIAVFVFAIIAAVAIYLWQNEIATASKNICPVQNPPESGCMCPTMTCPCA